VRWEFARRANVEPDFPDLPFRSHLTEWLMSVGPVFDGAMGPIPVPHSEIRAWAMNIGMTFNGAEGEWLRTMSSEYAGEITRSDGKNTQAPFVAE